ncbi:hypothetical protein HanRHA438_Chr12g0536131 [Helianthus annuus]|nr:hypothetical protein HanRHA438_Chr12g0536131 [Helianthus annuus]
MQATPERTWMRCRRAHTRLLHRLIVIPNRRRYRSARRNRTVIERKPYGRRRRRRSV